MSGELVWVRRQRPGAGRFHPGVCENIAPLLANMRQVPKEYAEGFLEPCGACVSHQFPGGRGGPGATLGNRGMQQGRWALGPPGAFSEVAQR